MKKKKHSDILGPVDTAFLYVESQETPMNIGAVTIFEGKIPFEDFQRLVESRIPRSPLYQKRVIQAPLSLGQWVWVFDPDFNIENHVMRAQIEAPGTEEQLRQLAGEIVSSPLDRSKPLWEMHIVENLEGDRTAMITKVHHCMVDGLAAVELFSMLLDLSPDVPDIPDKKPVYDPPPLPGQVKLLTDAAMREVPAKINVVKKLTGNALFFGNVLLDKEKRRKALIGIANLINDNMGMIKAFRNINGKNSGEQALAWVEFSLAEVRAIKSANGCTVNDVMLYVLASAIEMYMDERGEESEQDFLRVLVPVSMRAEEEKGAFGNRISVITIDVPFGMENPIERLKAVAEYSNVMKQSSLSVTLDTLLTLPSLALPVAQPVIWGVAPRAFSFIAHTWCTNVAGPQIPVYMLGHQMLHSYGYFPLNPSMGLACVVMSYNQKITMNLVSDKAIVKDVVALRECLKRVYVRLRQASKVPEMMPVQMMKVETPPTQPEPEIAAETETASDGTAQADGSAPSTNGSAPSSNGKLRLFTDEWAQAYREAINGNPKYKKASTNWEAGALAFVMRASPRHGYTTPAAVILDLHKGVCRDAKAITPDEAKAQATFVIEGDHDAWIRLLSGQGQPLQMLMRGKLSLKKGSVSKLMPYAASAQELINSAQKIPT